MSGLDQPLATGKPSLLMVSSASLDGAADHMGKPGVRALKNGVVVTIAQLRACAQILRDADPSVITSPRRLASTEEQPGWIDADNQEGFGKLVFEVGILPSSRYLIDTSGEVQT